MWEDFDAIDLFFLEFADNPQASGVTLYANGRNQVAVTLTFRARAKCGGYLPLTANDVLSVAWLHHTGNGDRLYSAEQKNTPWRAQFIADVFTQPVSWLVSQISSSDAKLSCDNLVRVTWYVSCSPWNTLAATSLSVGVTIAGKRYITDDYRVPDRHSHLLVDVLPQKKYVSNVDDDNSDVTLKRYDTATIKTTDTNNNSVSIDQDNYYLAFSDSSLYINKVDINSECWQGDLNATLDSPAKPFYTGQGSYPRSGFIWPLGTQKSVYCTLYTSPGEYASSFTDLNSFQATVNEYPGQLCLTRLAWQDSPESANDAYYYAYVTYYDQNGNSGNVILEPNSSDEGNTIGILNWQEVFGSFKELKIEALGSEGIAESSATIYANGLNQVGLRLRVEAMDTKGVAIPLQTSDISGLTYLCDYGDRSKLTLDGDASSTSSEWAYAGVPNDFFNPVYPVGESYVVSAQSQDTVSEATIVYYLYSQQNGQNNSKDIAMGITVNDVEYTTAENDPNYGTPSYVVIKTLVTLNYIYSGNGQSGGEDNNSDFTFTREDTAKPKSTTNSNYTADQDNYYVRLRSASIFKIVFSDPGVVETQPYTSGSYYYRPYYINSWDEGFMNGYIWAQGEDRIVIAVDCDAYGNATSSGYNHYAGNHYNIEVCQDGTTSLCLTRMAYNYVSPGYDTYHYQARIYEFYVSLYDQYGNVGYVNFPWPGGDANTIVIANGKS
ncbi:hypothetical protein [Photorhabdus namnaonensis]|uniref:Uncharacterized protein n=1 Tax=Photorhabdus namnaonensis TaxID=1851568 RepID=A0A1B8YMW6_9GAMM|nr:hypothetical protein [Photorhabdus namnaonensis]OCA56490.1 hypothetical protein Phpb_00397 [Photorhabdus namnaonensis]